MPMVNPKERYLLEFKSKEDAEKALTYMRTCLDNRGRISKYELELSSLGAKQANILDMNEGWYDDWGAKILVYGKKYFLELPLPRGWFS